MSFSFQSELRRVRKPILVAASIPVFVAAAPVLAAEGESFVLQEIVVTATRRAESLSKVPVSVSAFSQAQMDTQGLKQVDDLVRYTPGLVVARGGNGANNISIRGISSGAGAGTTGVYIDDTPIQVRNLAYSSGTAFPALFDLERVEVLRGPQGTLFGSGSEGGTVRFLQTSPSLTSYSAYARGEYSTTSGGDPTYEAGGAFGGPLIDGKLGFRVSAFHREDGGYIDGITGTPVVLDPTGDAGPASLTFTDRRVVRENTNSVSTTGFRGALKWAVTDAIEVTPSITYQKVERDDGFDTFWPAASSGDNYARPVYDAGNPATNPLLSALTSPDKDQGDDDFTLAALQVNWDFGPVELVSNTSHFDRESTQFFDFTNFYNWFYAIADFPRPGDKGSSNYYNEQRNFVQEVRLQSTDTAARWSWVVGAFYSDAKQRGIQDIGVNFLANAPSVGAFFLPFIGLSPAVTDGAPFGPGFSAFENYFGVPAEPNSSIWAINFHTRDQQLAGFAQTDFKITDALKLTTGVRVSRNELNFGADYSSPESNQNPTLGLPFPPLPPEYSSVVLNSSESSVTPKISLSYQLDDANMIYATAAKGFRPGGASQQVPPTLCAGDLTRLGYVDANGDPSQPLEFDSDSVWSYEIGTKNRLFNDRLVIDASAYHIQWDDIQTTVFLNDCAESFTSNIAEATSQGLDIGVQLNPLADLMLSGTVGYNKSEFGSDGLSPGGVAVVSEGGVVPGSPPPWVYSLSAQYDFNWTDTQIVYIRTDFTHSAEARRVGATDPDNPNYNPDLAPIEAYSIVNARIGTQWHGADVAIFVNNLTNENVSLSALNDSPLTGASRYTWSNSTLRPRTYGLFLTYRY